MKKRLRKKLGLAEFQELGVSLSFRFSPGLTEEARDELFDRWIEEAIEAQGLAFGGGGDGRGVSGYATVAGPGSLASVHTAVLETWLREEPKIEDFSIGELSDAWHGGD